MGAWGYGLLESDDAYDVVEQIVDFSGLSFGVVMECLTNFEHSQRENLKKTLNHSSVFNFFMKNPMYDQYIVFGIYASLGLFDLIENERDERIKNNKPDPIIVLRDRKYELADKIGRRKDKEDYCENISLVFGNYSNRIEYAIGRKGLFEAMLEQ